MILKFSRTNNVIKANIKRYSAIFSEFAVRQHQHILSNTQLSIIHKWKQGRLHNSSRFRARSSLTNRCLLSGRNRSVVKWFRLSRIAIRLQAHNGYINGLKKVN